MCNLKSSLLWKRRTQFREVSSMKKTFLMIHLREERCRAAPHTLNIVIHPNGPRVTLADGLIGSWLKGWKDAQSCDTGIPQGIQMNSAKQGFSWSSVLPHILNQCFLHGPYHRPSDCPAFGSYNTQDNL